MEALWEALRVVRDRQGRETCECMLINTESEVWKV